MSWNRQVQHILASASPSGKAVVWDLRKNEPIIKISDHSNRVSQVPWNTFGLASQESFEVDSFSTRFKMTAVSLRPSVCVCVCGLQMHCSGMLWHPDVATQLVLASEDDRLPVIQIWDLRFATSPLKVLENHTR